MQKQINKWLIQTVTFLTIALGAMAQTPKYVGYRCGFDIGSQGVKLSVVGFYFQNSKLRYKLVYDRQETVGLVKGMETNGGKLRPADIQEAIAFVQEMMEDAKSAYKLNNQDFIIYASSGVNIAPNIGDLDALAQKNLGMRVNINMPAKTEATYGARAGLAREDFDSAILVDVGGGNTKGGILQKYIGADGRERYTFKSYNIEFGARRLSERVQKRTASFDAYARGLKSMVEDSIAPLIRSSLNDNPEIRSATRSIIYTTGGVSYQFITWLAPEKVQEEIIEFKYDDLLNFYNMLQTADGWAEFETRKYDTVKDAKLKELMVRDLEKATKKVYNRDACLAGISLVLQAAKEIGNPERKTFYFTRDAYWINTAVYDTYKGDFKLK
ncbi:hypothetical protein [Runella slithyformis]|uniref:Ppx/GppA phosphatase domain-containing protein n=1 Tax=Runella slithyformis (strain ATCC 29530 / DSM 19594 / LMG 11500 / NCIMB 11436 / LSU 4) TaxID=761193 RepID=A0A7U4E4Z4_RUNSL|nr:hypothetical protein [Runella slithyformis]AEI47579.1 hypothetical protein Runsl_1150 [Runella slithyformis DSM 19594]